MHLQYVKHKEIFSKVERLYIKLLHLALVFRVEEQTARSGIYTLAPLYTGSCLFIALGTPGGKSSETLGPCRALVPMIYRPL